MDRVDFSIQGSAEEPYRISFSRTAGTVVGLCTCPAGQNGQWCKHRLGILRGEKAVCDGLSAADVETVRSWLPGTPLEAAVAEVAAAEASLAKAQAAAKAAKKRLSAALYGRS